MRKILLLVLLALCATVVLPIGAQEDEPPKRGVERGPARGSGLRSFATQTALPPTEMPTQEVYNEPTTTPDGPIIVEPVCDANLGGYAIYDQGETVFDCGYGTYIVQSVEPEEQKNWAWEVQEIVSQRGATVYFLPLAETFTPTSTPDVSATPTATETEIAATYTSTGQSNIGLTPATQARTLIGKGTDVPTNTPGPSSTPTETPTLTPTSDLPVVAIPNEFCEPGVHYLVVPEDTRMENPGCKGQYEIHYTGSIVPFGLWPGRVIGPATVWHQWEPTATPTATKPTNTPAPTATREKFAIPAWFCYPTVEQPTRISVPANVRLPQNPCGDTPGDGRWYQMDNAHANSQKFGKFKKLKQAYIAQGYLPASLWHVRKPSAEQSVASMGASIAASDFALAADACTISIAKQTPIRIPSGSNLGGDAPAGGYWYIAQTTADPESQDVVPWGALASQVKEGASVYCVPAPADRCESYEETLYVGRRVNVREGSSIQTSIRGILAYGEKVTNQACLVRSDGVWIKHEKGGWSKGEFLVNTNPLAP